jgi:hypothetical protein
MRHYGESYGAILTFVVCRGRRCDVLGRESRKRHRTALLWRASRSRSVPLREVFKQVARAQGFKFKTWPWRPFSGGINSRAVARPQKRGAAAAAPSNLCERHTLSTLFVAGPQRPAP